MNGAGVVIVTHNSEQEIGRCLDSIPSGLEVIVVDNASADGTRDEVRRRPTVRLFANRWNRGFAAAANQGIAALDCECVLLLNPDIELLEGIEFLINECKSSQIIAAGAKLLDPSGRPQLGFMVRRFPSPAALSLEVMGVNRLWPRNAVNQRYRCMDLDPEMPANVEQPAGALMMIRRDAWRRLGGFDESFRPVWFEDVDFARRAADAGYLMRYVPAATATHKGAHSVSQLTNASRELYWYGNLLTYATRHFARRGLSAVCLAVALGAIFRAIFGVFRRKSLKPFSIYTSVVRLAGRHFITGRSIRASLSSALAAQ